MCSLRHNFGLESKGLEKAFQIRKSAQCKHQSLLFLVFYIKDKLRDLKPTWERSRLQNLYIKRNVCSPHLSVASETGDKRHNWELRHPSFTERAEYRAWYQLEIILNSHFSLLNKIFGSIIPSITLHCGIDMEGKSLHRLKILALVLRRQRSMRNTWATWGSIWLGLRTCLSCQHESLTCTYYAYIHTLLQIMHLATY